MMSLDEAGNPSGQTNVPAVLQPGVAQQTDEFVFYWDEPVVAIKILQEWPNGDELSWDNKQYYLPLEIADQQPGIENAVKAETMHFIQGFEEGGAMILSPDKMDAVFTSTYTAPPLISGAEGGIHYFTTQKVTVKDTDLKSVTLNGEAVAFSGNSVEIMLPGDVNEDYTIIAEDEKGGKSQLTVWMAELDELLNPISSKITLEDVRPEDKNVILVFMSMLDNFEPGEHATAAEKFKILKMKDELKALLDRIDDAEAIRNSQSVQETKDITAENVKPADKAALERAKADLEKALSDYHGNYDDDTIKAIEDDLLRINDALDALAAMLANVPKTGDDSRLGLWVLMLALSAAGAGAAAFLGRKKRAE